VGCAPLYLKSHSYGEYVFDWGWAEAFQRAGGRYYPKLQAAVPFTPVPGPRLLVRADAPAGTAPTLAAAMVQLARQLGVSSLHVTFHDEAEAALFARLGFLPRIGQQYHWRNEGYGSFDDFLAKLSSRKRKAVRKERAEAASHGVRLRTLTGPEIEPRHWEAFYRFYLDTVERKWAHAYLTRDFFTRLGAAMAEKVLLIVAETDAGEPVGGALNLVGADALYGRYWGSCADYRFLHFEACYYRAIDFAIARGLARVEAGAQGAHKIQRGYLPIATHSAHWIAEAGFRKAVAGFLDTERPAVEAEIAELAAGSPFRRDGC
jgi:predicted N-acyltransferase